MYNTDVHAALADNEALREGKLHSLRQALDVYRARLGLQFRKGVPTRMLQSCLSALFLRRQDVEAYGWYT